MTMRRGREAKGLERRGPRLFSWAVGISTVAAVVIVGGTSSIGVHGRDTSGTLAAPATTVPAPSSTTTVPPSTTTPAPAATTTVPKPAPVPAPTTTVPKPAPVPAQ